ncbi:Signal recognition particle receptor subunit beta [Dirofilaria immitis]|nr:Signal recognition particle receptor subunit beta [Dirofilaria immitis]
MDGDIKGARYVLGNVETSVLIRSALVKMSDGKYLARPINMLYPLEVDDAASVIDEKIRNNAISQCYIEPVLYRVLCEYGYVKERLINSVEYFMIRQLGAKYYLKKSKSERKSVTSRECKATMEDKVWNESMDNNRFGATIKIWITCIVILVSILAYILKRRFTRGNTILIVGLCDSGKRCYYSPKTYTSLKENCCEDVLITNHSLVTLVDFPGSERLRKQLFGKYLQKNRNNLKGIIFVIDSSTFSKRSRDVAAFLYDVLYESEKKIPILVACNKQNCPLAKSSQAVRSVLEREFGYINGTREVALDFTDGKSFHWDDLSSSCLNFIECFVKQENEGVNGDKHCEIGAIQAWIAAGPGACVWSDICFLQKMIGLATYNIQRFAAPDVCLFTSKALASGRWWPQPLRDIYCCCCNNLSSCSNDRTKLEDSEFSKQIEQTTATTNIANGATVLISAKNETALSDKIGEDGKLIANYVLFEDSMAKAKVAWQTYSGMTTEERDIYMAHLKAIRERRLSYKDPKKHLLRGKCCGSGCRHCPFQHENATMQIRKSKVWNGAFYI